MKLEGLLVDLVPFTQPFLDQERDWLNGPMRYWWGQDGLITRAGQERRRERHQAEPGARDRAVRFGMMTKDNTPIGIFVLANIDYYHRTAEVGAGIGEPDYWGGGYGSDAMLLIVEYAYDWLDLRRLWLTTMGTNYRAQHQVEKCGFIRETTWRDKLLTVDGKWIDFLVYGMMREEWPGREAMIERLGLRDKARARAEQGVS